jgi:putative ABC transport system permease protein
MRLFRRSQREFEEEIRAHLDLETDQLIAEGHPPAEARQLARKRFGNVGRAQERYYDAGAFAWLNDAAADTRYALRLIRKHPGFSTSVMLISALGLVACVSTFSLVSGILLKPLPFPQPDHVFNVVLRGPGVETWALPISIYDSLAQSKEVDAVAAGTPRGVVVRAAGELRRSRALWVTPSYFAVYRLKPALGRFFKDATEDAVVLGYDEWRTRYGSDTTVIGRVLTVDGVNRRIVGVMPERFLDPRLESKPMWLPWAFDRTRAGESVNAVVRIADGQESPGAEAALRRHRVFVEGDSRQDSVMAAVGLVPITNFRDGFRTPLLILFGAVLLVLALVAANVATMFLAQVSSRHGELGVRRALGAGRGRQLRQLMVESLTLTTIGGAVGLSASVLIVSYVRGAGTFVLPRMQEVHVDWRVALFAIGVILITGLSGGLAQVFASRDRAWTVASTRVTSSRTSTTLVMTQMALSVVLLVGAGLLMKSFMRVAPDNPGFATQNRATLLVGFVNDREKRDTSAASVRSAVTRAQEALRGVSGIEDVAVGTYLPLTGLAEIADVEAPALNGKPSTVYQYFVSDNYFKVMHMAVTGGRAFTADDGAGSERVAIVSEAAARKLFGRRDVLGARFRITDGTMSLGEVTVVGTVNDTRTSPYDTKMRAQVYLPSTQGAIYGVTFIAATSIGPGAVIPALKRALATAAPRAVIEDASDLESVVGHSVDRSRFFSVAMALFAGTAALLTGLGIYGLLSYAVTQRRREIGIRLALGATTSRIGRTVLGRAAFVALVGVPIGLAAAYALSRFMGSLLLEVEAADLQVFILVPAISLLFALAAALAPVVQATRIDPNETMRV